MLAATINPADLMMVKGGYGIQAQFPAVGGNEGVGIVTEVGANVKDLKVKDRVIPAEAAFGTWREEAVAKADDLIKVSDKIPVEYAACLSVNPCTALRLLSDFGNLTKGDVIIQNGANSAVGQFVIQLAKLKGIKTVNVIRNSANYDDISAHLKGLGADIVCNDEYLGSAEFKRLLGDLPAPKLGIDCVGGKNAVEVARNVGHQGSFVVYGNMSHQPVAIPSSLLIFKQLNVHGFWLSDWVKNHSKQEKSVMLNELAGLMEEGKLNAWVEKYPFEEFNNALDNVLNKRTQRKVVLTMKQ